MKMNWFVIYITVSHLLFHQHLILQRAVLNEEAESIMTYIRRTYMITIVTAIVDFVTRAIKVTLASVPSKGSSRAAPPRFNAQCERSIREFEMNYDKQIVIVDYQKTSSGATLTILTDEDSVQNVSFSNLYSGSEYVIDTHVLPKYRLTV